MYDLTKVYKTTTMAVNAIRMTARNKGWTVLDTESAAEHVQPSAEGFSVNNATLNVALGFVAEAQEQANGVLAQRVPDGSVTDGAVLESVNAAIAEQGAKDAKSPKLQAPSKLEESKKEMKALKKAVKEEKTPAVRSEVKNGARRPAKAGKTLTVWLTTEAIQKEASKVPTIKEVYEALCKAEPGFNKTTCSIQYYACLAYNGWRSERKASNKA